MELKLSSNFSGKPVSVVVPIEKVIEVFWPCLLYTSPSPRDTR